MNKSISKRMMAYFVLIIILTVLILEVALLRGVRQYLYQNVEDLLISKIEITNEFYHRYFAAYSLDELLVDDVDVLWRQVDTQAQILDLEGHIIMDSIGYYTDEPIKTSDVLQAVNGDGGTWVGHMDYSASRLMAVSRPIYSDGTVIGILRLIGSLDETDAALARMGSVFIGVGIFVIGLALFFGKIMADTIVKPIRSLTAVAEKMGDGQLQVRSEIKQEDEIGKLAKTLNLMAAEILKREEIKNDFISSISHELRTPLTSIKGWAITLEDRQQDDEELVDEGLKIIEQESERLSKMVEELLDFSRFISGGIALDKSSFSVDHLLQNTYRQMLPRARNEGLNFRIEIHEPLGNYVGDVDRIRQVLINLIDNSIKFTPEGEEIILKGKRSEEWMTLIVEDHGIGIDPEDLPHVKDKFYKGKHEHSRSGIGLSVSDEIVKLHGGQLKVESVKGSYTIITVILPMQEEVS